MDVVAEGVETEAQLHYLATKDCGLFQGYYFAKPMPADEIEALVRSMKPLSRTPSDAPRTSSSSDGGHYCATNGPRLL